MSLAGQASSQIFIVTRLKKDDRCSQFQNGLAPKSDPMIHESLVPEVLTIQAGPSWWVLLGHHIADVHLLDAPLVCLYSGLGIWGYLLWRYRKSFWISTLLCGTTCLLIGLTRNVNLWMGMNWQRAHFSANYFDTTNFFIFAFWAFPLFLEVIFFFIVLLVEATKERDNLRPIAEIWEWVCQKIGRGK
jgi:hypothetical protein